MKKTNAKTFTIIVTQHLLGETRKQKLVGTVRELREGPLSYLLFGSEKKPRTIHTLVQEMRAKLSKDFGYIESVVTYKENK